MSIYTVRGLSEFTERQSCLKNNTVTYKSRQKFCKFSLGKYAHGLYLPYVFINNTDKLQLFSTIFYSASALFAMQSAVLARGILSVRLSVRLSFRHTLDE